MNKDQIAHLLPETYRAAVRTDNPLGAVLAAMEELHRPTESILGTIDSYFDPHRAPDSFALMLASWLDLDRYFEWTGGRPGSGTPRYAPGLGHLRTLSAMAAELMRERGTCHALNRFLTVATGISGFTIEENPVGTDGAARAFHIRVKAPASARRLADLVRRIVDEERPVYVTYEVEFAVADGS